jgi:hypothetical protein
LHCTSTITIQRAERPALQLSSGGWHTGRVYADFVVNGVPLSTRARRRGDLVSCLGWGSRAGQQATVARLLLEAPPDFSWGGGRTALYVCPEDGDPHCGAITAVIARDGDCAVWRDFGFETGTDVDPPELDQRALADLGPFRFPWPTYEAAIRAGYDLNAFHNPDVRATLGHSE